jgi:outer membrane protein TolC
MMARRQLFNAQTDLLQAEHDRFVAAAELLSYVGSLMPEDASPSLMHGRLRLKLMSEGFHP